MVRTSDMRDATFEALGVVKEPWSAALALELLPENNGPKIEVFGGSVVVTPVGGLDHRAIQAELAYRVARACRSVGLWGYHDVNLRSGEDLLIPDIVVLRRSGAGELTMPISDAVLLGQIVSPDARLKDVIDHPRAYASAGVPWYLRVDYRDRVPALALHELIDGDYQPVVAAAAGTIFEMKEPFAFAIDPGELLDDPAERSDD